MSDDGKDNVPAAAGPPAPVVVVRQSPSQAVWWVIAVSLLVIATCLVLRLDARLAPAAYGQSTSAAGARGVFAFTGQMSKNTYGLFMVDVDTTTVWCYEFIGRDQGRLRFAAARSWCWDRYLENHNLDPDSPSPKEVERMVELEREAKLHAAGGQR
jgi:hypothetical protein